MGDSRGDVQCFNFHFVGGNSRDLCYTYKNGSACKTIQTAGENGGGFTNWLSLPCGAFSRDLQDGKSKSPLFPRAGGQWLQMTCALQIVPRVPSLEIDSSLPLWKIKNNALHYSSQR